MSLPIAACVFVVREGKVLSVSRRGNDGSFALPGGKGEPGETPKQTAARECFEETGVVVGGLKLLYEAESDGFMCSTFFAMQFSGEARNMGEGMVSWIYPDQLRRGVFAEYNDRVLKAYSKLMFGT